MDIGNLLDKLEEDSRALILSAVFCFPIAYLDCWKMSLHFQQIELLPQIILAFGVGMLLVVAGVFFNMLFLLLADEVEIGLKTMIILSPTCVSSVCATFFNWTSTTFAIYFWGWCLLGLGCALVLRVCNKHERQ